MVKETRVEFFGGGGTVIKRVWKSGWGTVEAHPSIKKLRSARHLLVLVQTLLCRCRPPTIHSIDGPRTRLYHTHTHRPTHTHPYEQYRPVCGSMCGTACVCAVCVWYVWVRVCVARSRVVYTMDGWGTTTTQQRLNQD